MQRDEFGKMGEVIRIRLPLHLETEVRIKANELSGRDRGNMSQVIRDAIYSYFNSSIDDRDLLYASVNDLKEQVRFLENKIELQAVIILELTKHLLKVLPNRPSVNQEVADLEYLKFLDDVELALKQNHGGKLEAMVLDIYSDQLSKGGNK